MANFDSEFFGLVFPGFQATPKHSRPKFTSRIVGIPLQFHFLEPKMYSRRFSAHGGDQHLTADGNAYQHHGLNRPFPLINGAFSDLFTQIHLSGPFFLLSISWKTSH